MHFRHNIINISYMKINRSIIIISPFVYSDCPNVIRRRQTDLNTYSIDLMQKDFKDFYVHKTE